MTDFAAAQPNPPEPGGSRPELGLVSPRFMAPHLEALVSEARDYAEGIMDVVRQPLLVLDERRHVRTANRSFFRVFQAGREQLEGRPFEQLGEPRWALPELAAAVERLLAAPPRDDGRLEDTPTRFAGRSMLVSGRTLRRNGQPSWLLLAFEDLTEHMKADAAVRRSERALRDMLGAASEAILIAGGDGRITYANAMAARMFGYPLEELIGLHIEALVPDGPPPDAPDDRETFDAEPSHNPLGPNRELQGRRRDGTVFPADVGLSTMEGERGPLVVAFISDMSALKEHEQRISAYKKRLQEMAFDAALVEERQRRRLAADLHDNIGQTLALAQIRLKAAMANSTFAGDKDLGEVVKLLAQAMSDTRSLTFELSPPVLYDLGLVAALEWFGEQLEAQHGLHVVVRADERWSLLDTETAAMLFRAIRELLTNVVKHAATGLVRVSLAREANELVVVVHDQGKGFDVDRLKASGASRGFGLFSVREQVLRLGGHFEVTSSPQHGTRITLRVPHLARTPNTPNPNPKEL